MRQWHIVALGLLASAPLAAACSAGSQAGGAPVASTDPSPAPREALAAAPSVTPAPCTITGAPRRTTSVPIGPTGGIVVLEPATDTDPVHILSVEPGSPGDYQLIELDAPYGGVEILRQNGHGAPLKGHLYLDGRRCAVAPGKLLQVARLRTGGGFDPQHGKSHGRFATATLQENSSYALVVP